MEQRQNRQHALLALLDAGRPEPGLVQVCVQVGMGQLGAHGNARGAAGELQNRDIGLGIDLDRRPEREPGEPHGGSAVIAALRPEDLDDQISLAITQLEPDTAYVHQLEQVARDVLDINGGFICGDGHARLEAAQEAAEAALCLQSLPTPRTALSDACWALVEAYRKGAREGESIDWSEIDTAYRLACHALGVKED